MVNAIFCARGKLACTMLESIQMVHGGARVEIVEFMPDGSAGGIVTKLERLMNTHNHDERLIAMDLQCGGPWNAATMFAIRNPRLWIISGLSLSLVLELIDSQDNMDVGELYKHLIQIAEQTCAAWRQVATARKGS